MTVSMKPQTAVSFPETAACFGGDELRTRTFLDKYALRDISGKVVEKTPPEMWQRAAREIASAEELDKREEWQRKFYWLLEDFRFIPGGRIMFGAGQERQVTLLNCYVIPIKDDSIEAIGQCDTEMARTYSFGGGVGTDISILRPRGAPVNNSAIYSSGSVSWMEKFSTTTGIVGQQHRRGALMITIRCDHPDVLDFIEAKNDPERLNVRYANISVLLTDEFMGAVEQDGEFELWFENAVVGRIERKVRARQIWDKLIHNAWASAEPGCIFWDKAKQYSTTEYNGMEIVSTNPCAEIPLEPYGCCCLGSVNLAQFVKNGFTSQAEVDWPNLEKTLRYGARFLDNVLDYNRDKHPLPAQRETSLKSRRIGVGFTGFGDMLIELGLKYDSDRAIAFADKLFGRVKNIVYDESAKLASEKGAFPAYDYHEHIMSPFVQQLDSEVHNTIAQHGLRNAALLTVPPVGSGSVLAGCTSGIEPIFSLQYVRKSKSLSKDEFQVNHPLVRKYMTAKGLDNLKQLPDIFVTAHQIQPEMRVRMQAVIQQHIDHAISSTVNLPKDITPQEVEKIYFLAWQLGCKGITVYREGSREGILLTPQEAGKIKAQPEQAACRPYEPLLGRTYKFDTELGTLFVTVNHWLELLKLKEDDIAEVFLNIGKSGTAVKGLAEGQARTLSTALQNGVTAKKMIDQLRRIKVKPTVQPDASVVTSVDDAVAQALERESGISEPEVQPGLTENRPTDGKATKVDLCQSCGGTLIFTGGCYICADCAFTQCD